MQQSRERLSTMTTVHKHHAEHSQYTVSPAHPISSVHRLRRPSAHLASLHHSITRSTGRPHRSIPSSVNTSVGSQFAYPTPTLVPRGNAAIIGLSITIGLLLAFLILGFALWYLRCRISRSLSAPSDGTKVTSVGLASIRDRRVVGSTYGPSIEQPPVKPARPSQKVRTWYGKRVPSGWI